MTPSEIRAAIAIVLTALAIGVGGAAFAHHDYLAAASCVAIGCYIWVKE